MVSFQPTTLLRILRKRDQSNVQRIIDTAETCLVGGGADEQGTVVLDRQPRPAGPKSTRRRCVELGLGLVQAAERSVCMSPYMT